MLSGTVYPRDLAACPQTRLGYSHYCVMVTLDWRWSAHACHYEHHAICQAPWHTLTIRIVPAPGRGLCVSSRFESTDARQLLGLVITQVLCGPRIHKERPNSSKELPSPPSSDSACLMENDTTSRHDLEALLTKGEVVSRITTCLII